MCKKCQVNYWPLKKKYDKKLERSTEEAKKIHEILLKNGFNSKLELWAGYKHIDIALPDYNVNIEIDGKQHHNKKQALADLNRIYYSFKKGYFTLRIPNILVKEGIFETAEYIMNFLKASQEKLD